MRLTDWYWNRWIRKHGCKLGTPVSRLGKRALLTLEEGVRIGNVLVASHELSIGANTYIRGECHLQFVGSIGRFCSIGNGAVLGQEKNNHPTNWLSTHPFQYTDTAWQYDAPIEQASLGHDVWVGHNALVMEGVTVGTGAIIATRSVVTHDVPPYAIVAGVPARVIRYRYEPEMIERLLASQWWERDLEELKRLPLDDPGACVATMEGVALAKYAVVEVGRRGGRVVG